MFKNKYSAKKILAKPDRFYYDIFETLTVDQLREDLDLMGVIGISNLNKTELIHVYSYLDECENQKEQYEQMQWELTGYI